MYQSFLPTEIPVFNTIFDARFFTFFQCQGVKRDSWKTHNVRAWWDIGFAMVWI